MLLARAAAWLLSIPFLAGTCFAESECLKRTIPVGVFTKDGSPSPRLSAANLEGTFQKKGVAVESVQLPGALPRLILLIDTSGSMRASADLAIDAAEGVLFKLPPDIEVGLAFFAGATIPVQLPTTDRRATNAQLEALRRNIASWRGRTALRSALKESVKMFGSPSVGDAIYVVSDGDENASHAGERQVREGIVGAEVRVFALELTFEGGRPFRNGQPYRLQLESMDELETAVQVTGGAILHTMAVGPFPLPRSPLVDKGGNPTELARDLERQLRHFLDFYEVHVELPETVDKLKGWKLELAGLSKPQRDNLVLTYPEQLMPCR